MDPVVSLSDDEAEEPIARELEEVDIKLAQVERQLKRLLRRQQELREQRGKLIQQIAIDRRAPRADWSGLFSWSTEAKELLRRTFRLSAFRPMQQEVINATMQGRDVLCLLPSGGGKSLCYQLPTLLNGGCTLVISPLLSLIQDQVLSLLDSNIRVTALTSLTPKDEVASVHKTIEADEDLRLIYVTPERVVTAKRFLGKLEKLYKAGRLKRIAIDEAHCVSQWGNDFRPDYKKLGILKEIFPETPILALTATATHRVQEDIKSILRIPGAELFQSSVDRPNLFYEVRHKSAAVVERMLAWILEHFPDNESGIVYALTRKDCESVANQLNQAGMAAAFYHADMDPHLRQAVHQQWSQGTTRVIVATVAFGMGINKVDVRFVIHHSLSKSIENYYQESGRAGRDGKPARCLLFYRPSDVLRQASLVVTEPGWETHLFGMMRYADCLGTCRRAAICRHFGEAPAQCSRQCNVCAREQTVERRDITQEAAAVVAILEAVPAADKRLTLIQLIDRWRASKEEQHRQLAKAGSKDDNEYVIAQLLMAGVLKMDFGFTAYATNTYLATGPAAPEIRYGQLKVFMDALAGPQDALQCEEASVQPAEKKRRQS